MATTDLPRGIRMAPRRPRNPETSWHILRRNARDAVTRAPKESPLLLFATILLGLVALAAWVYVVVGF